MQAAEAPEPDLDPAAAAATPPVRGSGRQLDISLMTYGPGDHLWERFGHDAILIDDTAADSIIEYNYGVFDFYESHFFLNFARGDMQYMTGADDIADDLPIYVDEGRWAVRQTLQLTPAQREQLRDALDTAVLPENTRYHYDYFTSNCATKVRDAIDQVLGGELRRQLERRPAGHSYRFEVTRLMAPDRLPMLAMDLALGPAADRPLNRWQDAFLPTNLMTALRSVAVRRADGSAEPLVLAEHPLLPARLPAPPAAPPDQRTGFLILGLSFCGLLLILQRLGDRAWSRVLLALGGLMLSLGSGLVGLLLTALWAFTDHWAGWRNQNLLLFDPLSLLLLPAWFASFRRHRSPGRASCRLAIVILLIAALAPLLKLLPIARQENWAWILLSLPLQAGVAAALALQRRALVRDS